MSSSPEPVLQPSGDAPVWSDKRQSLCDALPYFKAHQGSLYSSRSVARGLLIDSEASIRDSMTSDVIISTLGGGREKGQNGRMIRTREGSARLRRSAANAIREGKPIGVVAGKHYPFFDVQPKHEYSVLGWFTMTDMWVEKDAAGIFIHKFRLEKTDKNTASWWVPGTTEDGMGHNTDTDQDDRAYPAVREFCDSCERDYAQVFTRGWVCLNAGCENHLVLDDGHRLSITDVEYASTPAAKLDWCDGCQQPSKTIFEEAWTCLNKECANVFQFPKDIDTNNLTYSQEFLNERTNCAAALEPLHPQLPVLSKDQAGTDIDFRCGLVCPKCHGCSRRKDWDGWVYETPDCDFVLAASPQPYLLSNIEKEVTELRRRKQYRQVRCDASVISHTKSIGAYAVEQFFLPAPDQKDTFIGSVHVFRATHAINARDGGADQLWDEIQQATGGGFDLVRNPVRTPGCKIEILTRHFQQNWGAPYKFVVNVLSKAFSDAPDFILKALMRMDWAGRQSVTCTVQDIDEHTEEAEISAAESLDRSFTPFNELLSLGYMEGDCISYHDDGEDTLGPTVATLSLGSPAIMAFRVKTKYNKKHPEIIQFPVFHGDIVVMHGAEIHKYYEHKVDPKGKRRFAMTSRHIDLDRLDNDTRREAKKKGSIPRRATKWKYDGQ